MAGGEQEGLGVVWGKEVMSALEERVKEESMKEQCLLWGRGWKGNTHPNVQIKGPQCEV